MLPQQVLVVEDDPKVAHTVRLYLESERFGVEHYADGRAALAFLRDHQPDLIILDLMLPGLDGLQLCERIRRVSSVPIIMLTAKTTDADHLRGFELGADDYVTKPFSPRQLMARVKAVLRRTRGYETEFVRHYEGVVLNPAKQTVAVDGATIMLTATQFRILQILATAPGRIYSRGELMDRALGETFEGSARIIDAHIKNIRRQLAQRAGAEPIIETVIGVGYKFARRALTP